MKLKQLICKNCGEYQGIKNMDTNIFIPEEGVKTSLNDELVICSYCEDVIEL